MLHLLTDGETVSVPVQPCNDNHRSRSVASHGIPSHWHKKQLKLRSRHFPLSSHHYSVRHSVTVPVCYHNEADSSLLLLQIKKVSSELCLCRKRAALHEISLPYLFNLSVPEEPDRNCFCHPGIQEFLERESKKGVKDEKKLN